MKRSAAYRDFNSTTIYSKLPRNNQTQERNYGKKDFIDFIRSEQPSLYSTISVRHPYSEFIDIIQFLKIAPNTYQIIQSNFESFSNKRNIFPLYSSITRDQLMSNIQYIENRENSILPNVFLPIEYRNNDGDEIIFHFK